MGTPRFAADILEELISHEDVICVYTQPDKVRSRGNKTTPTPVKCVAEKGDIPVRCLSNFKDPESISMLAELEPDVVCVAAFGAILPRSVLEIPRLGCVNVHASLLPRWRGAAPVERAILAGDEEVGVCIMRMEEGLDTGPYCIRRAIPIQGMSAEKLTQELASLGAGALLSALEQMRQGCVRWVEQDEDQVTYARKLERHELFLDPSLSAWDNVARVQASSDAHPAKCRIGERNVRVLSAGTRTVEVPREPGWAQFSDDGLSLSCDPGVLVVDALKPDGKREMDASQFAQGYPPLREGVHWSAL